jgi:hypothetical protein
MSGEGGQLLGESLGSAGGAFDFIARTPYELLKFHTALVAGIFKDRHTFSLSWFGGDG